MGIPKNSLHLVMQSKGGAGKSVCSFLLSQYFVDRLGVDSVQLVDTDPNNKTLSSFKGLKVKEIDILTGVGMEKLIDPAKFDIFINDFLDSDKPMVVDTGSGDYLAIVSYFNTNNVINHLIEANKEVYIHCPINFGQSSRDTLHCFVFLATSFPQVKMVAWENEFFGLPPAEKVNLQNLPNYVGAVNLPKRQADTFERDFASVLTNRLTFEEVRMGLHPQFKFMNIARIARIKNETFEQIDNIFN